MPPLPKPLGPGFASHALPSRCYTRTTQDFLKISRLPTLPTRSEELLREDPTSRLRKRAASSVDGALRTGCLLLLLLLLLLYSALALLL